jgi:hypothetical protein
MLKKNTGISYENLAQQIFNEILNQDSVKTINVQHNVMIQGKTTSHQIDIFWEFEVGGIRYCTIVQAKDWKSTVPQGAILQFKAILDDLPGQPRGIFVTRTGYQNGAIDVAKANGILLYELREPTEADWEGKIKTIVILLHALVPRTKNLNIVHDEEWVKQQLQQKGLEKITEKIQIAGMTNEIFLYDLNFQPIMTIKDVVDSFFSNDNFKKFGPVLISKKFDEYIYIETTSLTFPFIKIDRIEAEISIIESVEEIKIDGENIVGFILKNVLNGSIQTFDKQVKLKKRN